MSTIYVRDRATGQSAPVAQQAEFMEGRKGPAIYFDADTGAIVAAPAQEPVAEPAPEKVTEEAPDVSKGRTKPDWKN